MQLEVSGPLSCATVAWRARAAGEVLTVVCKASYDLEPGVCVVRAVQDPLRERDQPYGDDPRRPMYAPADLVPYKPRAEVVLVGSAFALGGVAVSSLVVRLAAAGVDKSIEVYAERRRYPNGQVVSGPPFARASLGWDHAAAAPTNPIGVRSDIAVDAHGGVVLPRLVMPQAPPGTPWMPAGFGPIVPHWPGRLEKLGRSGIHALPRSWNAATLADDLDPQFFQVAPPDQQVRLLRADEPLLLVNMSPSHPHLATRLPGVFPAASVERAGRSPEALALLADTLWIDTDRALCTLTWRGLLRLSHAAEAGVVRVRMEGSASPPADPIAAAIIAARERTDATAHLAGSSPLGPAMPFVTGAAAELQATAFAQRLSAVVKQAREDAGATRPVSDAAGSAPALPFEGTAAVAAPPPAPADSPEVVPAPVAVAEAMPAVEPPLVEARPKVIPAPLPPPMIGRPATPEIAAQPALETTLEVPATAEAPAPSVKGGAPLDRLELLVDRCPIERCAAIAASIARRRTDKPNILHDNGLSPGEWDSLEKHWAEAIRKEIRRGQNELLRSYDAAYLRQLEKERGPITVQEYAQLVVAAERGTIENVLGKLGLPKGAMLRIERAWIESHSEDPARGKHVQAAIDAARAP